MPELPQFYDWLSAEDQLKFYCEFDGYSRAESNKRSKELIELVGLGRFGKSKIKTFSHGMKKRLALGQALVNDPDLLILDEPMGGLDPMGVRAFRQMIKELNQNDITIFLSSHILSEVQQVCNKVGIINHGRILAVDEISKLGRHFEKKPAKNIYIEGKGLSQQVLESIKKLSGTLQLYPKHGHIGFYVQLEDDCDEREYTEKLNKHLVEQKVYLSRIEIPEPSLEELFMSITGESK
jgi:ABC-2 type transport system ATP-binding protein